MHRSSASNNSPSSFASEQIQVVSFSFLNINTAIGESYSITLFDARLIVLDLTQF
jgi:hypothetical protein